MFEWTDFDSYNRGYGAAKQSRWNKFKGKVGTKTAPARAKAGANMRNAGRHTVGKIDDFVEGAENAGHSARYSKGGQKVEYAVKRKRASKSTSVIHVPGKGTGAASIANETPNQQHLRLMREKLSGMDRGSAHYSKLYSKIEALEGHMGVKNGGGGPAAPRKRFSERVSAKFNQTFVGDKDSRYYLNYGRSTPKGGKHPNQARDLRRTRTVRDTVGIGGAVVSLGGGLASAIEMESIANMPSKSKWGSKKHNRKLATVRHGWTAQGGGAAASLNIYGALEPRHALDWKSRAALNVAAIGAGSAIGYGIGRLMAPKNKISTKQKYWVSYTKHTHTGQVIRVRRKNPYYGKQKLVDKALAKQAASKARKKGGRKRGKR